MPPLWRSTTIDHFKVRRGREDKKKVRQPAWIKSNNGVQLILLHSNGRLAAYGNILLIIQTNYFLINITAATSNSFHCFNWNASSI